MKWTESVFAGLYDAVRVTELGSGTIAFSYQNGDKFPTPRYLDELFFRYTPSHDTNKDELVCYFGEPYHVTARPLEAEGRFYFLTGVNRLSRPENRCIPDGREDAGIMSRSCFEEALPSLGSAEAAAFVSPDGISSPEGMLSLGKLIKSRIRSNDTLIRYEENTFLLLFGGITEQAFLNRMNEIVADAPLLAPAGTMTVSAGGLYGEASIRELPDGLKTELEKAKKAGNCFVCPSSVSVRPEPLFTFSDEYRDVLSLDFDTDSMEVCQSSGAMSAPFEAVMKQGYEALRLLFAETYIPPAEQAAFLRETSPENVLNALREDETYFVQYALLMAGRTHYCRMKFMPDTRPGKEGRILIGGRSIDSEMRQTAEKSAQRERRELALHHCIHILNSGKDAATAIQDLLKAVASYYGAERVYIDEISGDEKDIRPVTFYSENPLPDTDLESLRRMDLVCLGGWLKAFKEKGEFYMKISEYGEEQSASAKLLRENGVSSIALAPLFRQNALVGFLGLDNLSKNEDDLFLLRSVATFTYTEILRREQAERETKQQLSVIAGLADDYDYIAFADLSTGLMRPFRISPVFEKMHAEWMTNYDYAYRQRRFAENNVVREDRYRFLGALSLERIRKELAASNVYYVNYTLNVEGKLAAYQTKIVRAGTNADGILYGVKNVETERQEELRRQAQLELTVAERTAELREKNAVLREISEDVVEFTGTLTEARDKESGEHISRVKGFTHILAEQVMRDLPSYGLNEDKIRMITSASALHDIGKIMIPDAVLLKPGRLTDEEFALMKTHCERGAEILTHAPRGWSKEYMQTAQEIILCHHEKYDGGGYPRGLKGDEIPISAQIVSIADCYDALTTERVYKRALPPDTAFRMITGGECGSFSPELLACFTRCREAFESHARNIREVYASDTHPLYASKAFTGVSILLIENGGESFRLTCGLLEDEGVRVFHAAGVDGCAAYLNTEEASALDAVLVDMAGMGAAAIDVVTLVRSMASPGISSLPIIGLTDSPPPAQESRDMPENGFNAFLSRPFSVISLTRVLMECMRKRSLFLGNRLLECKAHASGPLEGIRTMASYTGMVQKLTESLHTDDKPAFALVYADINNLREVNARFGHDSGDAFIDNCSALLASTFTGSPIYRIGGDEFVIVLTGHNYETREELMNLLCDRVTTAMRLADIPSGRASLAAGLGVYDPATDVSVSDVYERAEAAMMRNKALMNA